MQPDDDREAATVLQSCLEAAVQLDSFPKSIVHLNCVIMESAGSDLAVLITAASLALADAGIPMFDLVTACSLVGPHQPLTWPSSFQSMFSYICLVQIAEPHQGCVDGLLICFQFNVEAVIERAV